MCDRYFLGEDKVRCVERVELDVCMRHFESFDDDAGAECLECLVHRFCHLLCHKAEVSIERVLHIKEIVDVLFGDHERLASIERSDVHDGDTFLILIYDMSGYLSCDDLFEYGHMEVWYQKN